MRRMAKGLSPKLSFIRVCKHGRVGISKSGGVILEKNLALVCRRAALQRVCRRVPRRRVTLVLTIYTLLHKALVNLPCATSIYVLRVCICVYRTRRVWRKGEKILIVASLTGGDLLLTRIKLDAALGGRSSLARAEAPLMRHAGPT